MYPIDIQCIKEKFGPFRVEVEEDPGEGVFFIPEQGGKKFVPCKFKANNPLFNICMFNNSLSLQIEKEQIELILKDCAA